jgi:hypothetical protein
MNTAKVFSHERNKLTRVDGSSFQTVRMGQDGLSSVEKLIELIDTMEIAPPTARVRSLADFGRIRPYPLWYRNEPPISGIASYRFRNENNKRRAIVRRNLMCSTAVKHELAKNRSHVMGTAALDGVV